MRKCFTFGIVFIYLLITGLAPNALADDWPEWRGSGRDGDWTETGIVSSFEATSLKTLWRQKISAGYSGPTVANGKVYVMDRLTAEQNNGQQAERVVCLDEKTGQEAWVFTYNATYRKVGYVAGPRASVTIHDGHAYSVGTMGHVHCLNAITGELIWAVDGNQEYRIVESRRMPIWGIAGSPLIYKDAVIVHLGGADGACLVAFDLKTGKEKWRALDDRAQYSSPILVKQNGQDVLLCWTGDNVAGLNPSNGNVHWLFPFKPKNMPIGVATPIVQGNRVFFTSFYDGALLLELSQTEMSVKPVWQAVGPNERSTKALHSIISTPVWIDDHIYGVDSYGEMRCLKAATGERVWENMSAVPKSRWSTIHFVQNGKQTWMFNERGELILGELTPAGFTETCRALLIAPTKLQLNRRGGVCWSHPAFANRCIIVRNDEEIRCISLAK